MKRKTSAPSALPWLENHISVSVSVWPVSQQKLQKVYAGSTSEVLTILHIAKVIRNTSTERLISLTKYHLFQLNTQLSQQFTWQRQQY